MTRFRGKERADVGTPILSAAKASRAFLPRLAPWTLSSFFEHTSGGVAFAALSLSAVDCMLRCHTIVAWVLWISLLPFPL